MRTLLHLAAAVLLAVHAAAGTSPSERWSVAVFPSGAQFTLEIAATDEERALGYMYREEIGPHEGMLFIFERSGRHGIWMKNCKVPLDIIWLDDAFRVVHVASEVPPCTRGEPCLSTVPPMPARYVLEIAAGRSEAEGLFPGDTIVVLSDGTGR